MSDELPCDECVECDKCEVCVLEGGRQLWICSAKVSHDCTIKACGHDVPHTSLSDCNGYCKYNDCFVTCIPVEES